MSYIQILSILVMNIFDIPIWLHRMNIFNILIWSGCEEQIYSLYSIDRHKILYIQILSFLVMNIFDIPIWLSC